MIVWLVVPSAITHTTSRESAGGLKLAVVHGSAFPLTATGVEASTTIATGHTPPRQDGAVTME